MGVTAGIRNFVELKKDLESMAKEKPQKVLNALTADARKRVPGWVATEVVQHYGVKKQEITGQKIGTLRVKGNSAKNLKFIYRGRLLTPTHFSMTPKTPKPNGGAYTLKASIIKGERATLGKVKKLTKKQRRDLGKNFRREGMQRSDHSPVMLMRTGNKQAGGTNHIPFQRKSHARSDVEAIKTLSLPQMVSSDRTKEGIQKAINAGLEKRLDHHMKRFMGE